MRDRKRLLAALLEEGLLRQDREHRRSHVTLRWKGGWVDEIEVPWGRGIPEPVRTEAETVDVVRRLARQCPDAQIARTLNRLGRRTATGLRFNVTRVRAVRKAHGVQAYGRREGAVELWSVKAAAEELGAAHASRRKAFTRPVSQVLRRSRKPNRPAWAWSRRDGCPAPPTRGTSSARWDGRVRTCDGLRFCGV